MHAYLRAVMVFLKSSETANHNFLLFADIDSRLFESMRGLCAIFAKTVFVAFIILTFCRFFISNVCNTWDNSKLQIPSADTVLGYLLFCDIAPDQFGRFDTSFDTMLSHLTGEARFEDTDIFLNIDDSTNVSGYAFCYTFLLLKWMLPLASMRFSITQDNFSYSTAHILKYR